MKNMLGVACLVLLAELHFPFDRASAQINPGSVLSQTGVERSTANYYYAKPNELTITVDVVGMVLRPGRYEISNNINLMNLMALAGGGMSDASLSDVKVTRIVDSGKGIRLNVLHVDLEDVSKVNPSNLLLQAGDIIQVEKSGWASFRDAFSVVVSAAIITTAISQVIIATK